MNGVMTQLQNKIIPKNKSLENKLRNITNYIKNLM